MPSNPLSAWLTQADERMDRRALSVVFGLILVSFWPTLQSLPGTWSSNQDQGFFVAGLVVWLLWRHREQFFQAEGPGMTDLLPIVGLLSFGWLLAVIMNLRVAHQLLLWLTLVGWALVVFGPSARRMVAAIALTFLLAIPIWNYAVPVLQRATTIVSGGLTQLAGINAEIGYDTISLTVGTFLVEESCAGLSYLMAALTLGAFYVHFFVHRWQSQLKIVGLAAGMSIFGNWVRVTFLVFVGEATAMQSPMLEDHRWQGWVIFTLLMIPTYFAARRIEERDSGRPRTPELVPAAHDPERVGRALGAGAMALLGPILLLGVGLMRSATELDRDPEVFDFNDAWAITASTENWTPDFQGIDERAEWAVSVEDTRIEATRFYFQDQRQGEELIQWGNVIAPDSLMVSERLIIPVRVDRRVVREAFLIQDDAFRIVWYWYRVAGIDTPFPTKAKLLEILAFFRRSPAAELVLMSAGCKPNNCDDAAVALRAAVGGPGEGSEPLDELKR